MATPTASDSRSGVPWGFWCFLFAAVVTVAIGLVYTLRTELMPYHLEVLGTSWEQLPPRYRLMFRSLINGAGAATLATGAALLILTLVPLRRGEPWARWALLLVGLLAAGPTTIIVLRVALTTTASPPWALVVLLDLVLFAGFFLSKPRKKG